MRIKLEKRVITFALLVDIHKINKACTTSGLRISRQCHISSRPDITHVCDVAAPEDTKVMKGPCHQEVGGVTHRTLTRSHFDVYLMFPSILCGSFLLLSGVALLGLGSNSPGVVAIG